ncbi:LysE family translocator [Pseudoalteromonas sp. SMS1]|uniref:LysE family translocator n=1 Tax=Pseudoalteromonas sp. SMS1 TaxID=2908894 RepID=UPI001F3863DA|nr:LysE family translocator [Pseudoalteromonas sp. SMS1]MCF2860132.1 LysE family translocator [Pseudoalteromonas sp. SMS1]
MSIESYIALFSAMFIVGIIPGPAVFAIMTTSLTGGFRRGASMTLGLVVADYVFILLAVSGLSLIAESMGSAFAIIKYVCAAYLVWMGINLCLSKPTFVDSTSEPKANRLDILAGFLLSMSNPKAIIFYIALFPAFVDFQHITQSDILGIFACATLAFGSVNLGYAYLSSKARTLVSNSRRLGIFNKVAGGTLSATGIAVALRS